MADIEFRAWPKTPRLYRDIILTEKIDGTNAAVIVDEDGAIGAQSRNRIITPDADNFGFASWVAANAGVLAAVLGPGHHYGEWWGAGIQRRYGLAEKRFSLFNVNRYADANLSAVNGLGLVPEMYRGEFDGDVIRGMVEVLRRHGSFAAPGFMSAEGIIVFHTASGHAYKVLLENDDRPKGAAA